MRDPVSDPGATWGGAVNAPGAVLWPYPLTRRRVMPVYWQGRAASLLAALAQILASTVAIIVVVTR